jgi:hypothetical protein
MNSTALAHVASAVVPAHHSSAVQADAASSRRRPEDAAITELHCHLSFSMSVIDTALESLVGVE